MRAGTRAHERTLEATAQALAGGRTLSLSPPDMYIPEATDVGSLSPLTHQGVAADRTLIPSLQNLACWIHASYSPDEQIFPDHP